MKKEEDKSIFSNANTITTLLLLLVIAIIIISQSFAISYNLSVVDMFLQVINYNYIYFLLLIYFILLKTNFGKKYFNYINVGLIVIYLIKLISTFFTLFQTLTLSTLLGFIINIVIVLFLTHTLFRDTRVWREYKFNKSPFNEIDGDMYYDFIVVAASVLLAVDLIGSTSLNGVVLSVLDYVYLLLFSRYIYLYSVYLDKKKVNVINDGSIDIIVEKAFEVTDNVTDTVVDTLDDVKDIVKDTKKDVDNYIDEKVNEVDKFIKDNKLDDKADNLKKEIDEFIEEKKIDEKIDNLKEDIDYTIKEIKGEKKATKKKTTKKKETVKKTTKKSTEKKDTKKKGSDK